MRDNGGPEEGRGLAEDFFYRDINIPSFAVSPDRLSRTMAFPAGIPALLTP